MDLPFTDVEGLQSAVASEGIGVLYVCDGLEENVPMLTQYSRSSGLLTLTGIPGMVNEGISIAIEPRGGTAKVVINMAAAEAEGSKLDAQLLAVADLIQ